MSLLSVVRAYDPLLLSVMTVGLLGIIVLAFVAQWKLFQKAGVPGWKSLIPVLNSYTMFKLFSKTSHYFLTILTSVLLAVPTVFLQELVMSNFALALLTDVLSLVISILQLVWLVKLYRGMAWSFGRSDLFALGLMFCSLLFQVILGFDSSQYRGNMYDKKKADMPEIPVGNNENM